MTMTPEELRSYNRENMRRWRAANPERAKAVERARYQAAPEKGRERTRRWRDAHPDRAEQERQHVAEWRDKNPDKVKAESEYRAAKRSGTAYNSWMGMIQRCTNPKNPRWIRYGGRGITVFEGWRTYANFLADMGERPQGMTLDRIDNDGNYERSNCRWATAVEQRHNRRDSLPVARSC